MIYLIIYIVIGTLIVSLTINAMNQAKIKFENEHIAAIIFIGLFWPTFLLYGAFNFRKKDK